MFELRFDFSRINFSLNIQEFRFFTLAYLISISNVKIDIARGRNLFNLI